MNSSSDKIKSFTDLRAWKESHQLALKIYEATDDFPESQKFGLTSQLQRAAVSVPSNIAEGFGRSSTKDQTHFLYISLGSINEIQSQLLIAKDLGYLSNDRFQVIAQQSVIVSKLLNGLIKTSKNR